MDYLTFEGIFHCGLTLVLLVALVYGGYCTGYMRAMKQQKKEEQSKKPNKVKANFITVDKD